MLMVQHCALQSKARILEMIGGAGNRLQYSINTNYILHGQVLETVRSAKYLGVDVSRILILIMS